MPFIKDMQESKQEGEDFLRLPGHSRLMFEVTLLGICSLLFLFPGLLTDVIAFALILRPVRELIWSADRGKRM